MKSSRRVWHTRGWTFRSLTLLIALVCLTALNVKGRGTAYGVFVSRDSGESWGQADAGLPGSARINALTTLGGALVAGTDVGIFVSTNDAKSWRPARVEGSERVRVTSLVASKDRLWAGTVEGFLLVSRDGRRWEANQNFPPRWVRSLHVAKDVIYAGTDVDSVYRSADEGKTWTQMAAGLPAHAQVFALASIEGQVFAGLYAKGLYGWNESEEKWTQVGGAAGIKPLALAVSDGTVIAGHNPGGIYWSGDRGGSWERWMPLEDGGSSSGFDSILTDVAESAKMTALPVIDAPIWEMAADSKLAIAGASDGIYLSRDRGRTWTRATNGLPAHGPGIAFHLSSSGVIFAEVHLRDASWEAGRK